MDRCSCVSKYTPNPNPSYCTLLFVPHVQFCIAYLRATILNTNSNYGSAGSFSKGGGRKFLDCILHTGKFYRGGNLSKKLFSGLETSQEGVSGAIPMRVGDCSEEESQACHLEHDRTHSSLYASPGSQKGPTSSLASIQFL